MSESNDAQCCCINLHLIFMFDCLFFFLFFPFSRTLFPVHRTDLTEEMFEASDVDPHSRSYMLSVGEIGRLCNAYDAICQREPDIFTYDYRSSENAANVRRKNQILTEMIEAQILHGQDSSGS